MKIITAMTMIMMMIMTMIMMMIVLVFLIYIGFIFTYSTFVVPLENSSIVSFDCLRM